MSVLSENRPPVFGYYVNDAFVAVKEGEIYCKPLPHIYDLDIEIDGNNFSNLKDRDKIYYDLNPNSNIELNIKYCDYEKIKSESLVFKAELKDISKTKVTGGETSQLVVNEKGAKEFSLDLNLTQTNVSGIFNVDMSLSCKDINDSIFDFTRNVIIDKTANLKSKKGLAKLHNEYRLSFDKTYSKKYLEDYNNFSNINYKLVDKDDSTIMKVGARKDNIKGFDIDNNRFAVHLIHCDRRSQSCAFRINGVPTGKLHVKDKLNKKTEFSLTKGYTLKINSIKFDYSEEYLFKVMVTDGVNGNYSYSNTVAMGVMIPNITVTSLQGIYSDNTHKIFQFIILNNGDITLTDINWTINFGDTNTTESLYKFNLTTNEQIFVFVEHNYTDNQSHTVTANAYAGNLTASRNTTVSGINDLQITSFSELYSMGREKVWGFAIKNNAGTNITGINWNITGTDAVISSIYSFNLTPNETIRVYVHENLTNYQDYTITAKAFTDSTSGTGTLNTKGKELEVSNIKTLYTNGLTKILEFLVTNTYTSTITNINWSFYTGENTIDSIYTFNLTIIEFRKVDDRTSVLVLKIN